MRVKGNNVIVKSIYGDAYFISLEDLHSLRVRKKDDEPSYETLHIVYYRNWNCVGSYDGILYEDEEVVITKREYEKLKDYLDHNEKVENLGSETEITEETCYRLIEEEDD